MKTNSKQLDKFFTKDDVAIHCLYSFLKILEKDNIDYTKYTFIEPSAGGGAFLRALDQQNLSWIAGDIDPIVPQVFKNDFLSQNSIMDQNLKNDNNLIIGNPPFGKRSKLAIDFMKKSFDYSNYIGFILPIQFLKYLTQKQLPEFAKLIHSEILETNSFTLDDKEVKIRCVFQVWAKETTLKDLRIRTAPPTKHKDFQMLTYNCTKQTLWMFDEKWDFAVLRQGWEDFKPILYKDKELLNTKKQWMFFKANDIETLEKLLTLNFNKIGELNTSVRGFGKADVVAEYSKM